MNTTLKPYLLLSSLLFWTCYSQICPNQGRECVAPECCSTHGFCGIGDAWCGEGNTMFPVNNLGNSDNSDTDCPQCPICPGENRTLSPTPAPVEQPVFTANCNCHCYGDPHCQMWNCAVNNYQGPHGANPAGQFYYLTPCKGRGFGYGNMPFNVIGVNQRYDGFFTSVDYTILELIDDDGDKAFCIKTKGNSGVSYNLDCGNSFPNTPNQGEWVKLSDKFRIKYENINGLVYLYLDVLTGDENSGGCTTDLTIMSTTATVKEEGVTIKISDCYKKFTCGICGNFYDPGLYFERIDGTYMTLSSGSWGGSANHADGLSFLVEGTMGARRRLIDENDEPCYGKLDDLEAQCGVEIDVYSDCCDERAEFCDEIVTPNCKWDACSCVMGYDEGDVDDDVIVGCVATTLAATMNSTCIMPADDFAIPESLGIEEFESVVNGATECEDNSATDIVIGIVIGCAIFIVIDIIIYFACIKAKLDAVQNGYGGVDVVSTEQSDDL